jgi:signal recognition particle GTPase
MAVLYKTNPKNPVDFLGKWLLNVSQVQKSAVEQKNAQHVVNQHITAHKKAIESQEEEKEKLNEKKRQIEKTVHDFNHTVDHSHDLNDMLPELNNLLLSHTNSTAVYIGKLV